MKPKYTRTFHKNRSFKGTSLFDFLWLLSHYDWTPDDKIVLDVFINDSEESVRLSVETLKKDYSNYQVLDYDMWHEIINENEEVGSGDYCLVGMIEIFKEANND